MPWKQCSSKDVVLSPSATVASKQAGKNRKSHQSTHSKKNGYGHFGHGVGRHNHGHYYNANNNSNQSNSDQIQVQF